MKLKTLAIYIFLATILLGCQDDMGLQINPDIDKIENNGKKGYFGINLKLLDSDDTSTRATTYEDGYDFESAIMNFRVLVFTSDTEITNQAQQNEAKYIGYAEWNAEAASIDGTDDITKKSGTYVVYLEKLLNYNLQDKTFSTSDRFYCLVLANYDFNSYNTIDNELANNPKFETIYNLQASKGWSSFLHNKTNYYSFPFFTLTMSSAAYWQGDNKSPFKDPLILTPCNINKVAWTDDYNNIVKEDLTNISVANVYVQRNCSKLSFEENLLGRYYTIEEGPNTGDRVYISNTGYDIFNTDSFILQNTTNLKQYINEIYGIQSEKGVERFHAAGNSGFNHVNWSIDPNYFNTGDFTREYEILNKQNAEDFLNWTLGGGSKSHYISIWAGQDFLEDKKEQVICFCYENTGDINSMKKRYTTSFCILASYTVQGDNSSGDLTHINKYMIIPGDITVYNETRFLNKIKEKIPEIESVSFKDEVYFENDSQVKFSDLISYTPTSISINDIAEVCHIQPDQNVRATNGRKVYYRVPVRHFSDEDMLNSPLNYDDNGKVKYEKQHLGRWGNVRNHWYELSVESFTGCGEGISELPNDEDEWDDPNLLAIPAVKYKVYVSKWQKHSQDITFN